eukprot:9900932-Lingulodinium_polyedra.AAC.1
MACATRAKCEPLQRQNDRNGCDRRLPSHRLARRRRCARHASTDRRCSHGARDACEMRAVAAAGSDRNRIIV